MNMRNKAITIAAGLALLAAAAAPALAEDFTGKWKVKDTAGKPFEITLMKDGSAKSTQGEGYAGKWKEEGGAAMIKWDTGWTTKIAKEGDGYTKTAFEKGKSADDKPINTSKAEKAE